MDTRKKAFLAAAVGLALAGGLASAQDRVDSTVGNRVNSTVGTRSNNSGVRAPSGTRAPAGGVRAPAGGVRAPAGGVRAPAGGVRAPAGGVRAPAGGVRAPSGGTRAVQPGYNGAGSGRPTPSAGSGSGSGGSSGGGSGSGGGGGSSGGGQHHGNCYPYYWSWNWWGWGWSRWGIWYGVPDRFYGTVDGPSDRELEGATRPQVEYTDIELARLAMGDGEPDEAMAWYRSHLDANPLEFGVMREYAVAMLEAGRPLDAVALMGYAYGSAPGLSSVRMDEGLWGGSPLRMRASVVDAVRFAQRSPSGNSWLLVAVLMQAEGRDDVALKMLERAVGQGLDPFVADRVRLALARQ